jgi:hypothetical protein
MSYSIRLSDRLVARLFKPPVMRDHRARYDPLNKVSEDVAELTWAVHGICLDCRTWSITAGRCVMCDRNYSSGATGLNLEVEIEQQIFLASNILAS